MVYEFKAKNEAVEWFQLGAFVFPVLLEAFGYLYPCVQEMGRWYCVFGADERMPKTDNYPALLSNDGFAVTAEEAKIMARMARNYVAVQRSLPEPPDQGFAGRFEPNGKRARPFPQKIRRDFTDKFEEFAEWAERSGGFEIH